MCVYSKVMDRHWPKIEQWTVPKTDPDYEALKLRIEAIELELAKARQQDLDEGNPDCETLEKKIKIAKEAERLGIQIRFP